MSHLIWSRYLWYTCKLLKSVLSIMPKDQCAWKPRSFGLSYFFNRVNLYGSIVLKVCFSLQAS